jgi:hypothetical protein
MTKDDFLATLIDKMCIDNDDALLLANYVTPPDVTTIETSKIIEKITEIIGPYRSFKDPDFVKLKDSFESYDQMTKDTFIDKINMLITDSKVDHIRSKNFTLFLQATDVKFDKSAFIVLLLRKSNSISMISVFAIKYVMEEFFSYKNKLEEEKEVKNEEISGNLASKKSFTRNVHKVILGNNVIQAVKEKQAKPDSKTNIRRINRIMTGERKNLEKVEITKTIQKFIRGETLSKNENSEGHFGQKFAGL